jgi:biopolymer transport protein ExbD
MTTRVRVYDDTMAEINITPFADVLLVLLIIFMILAALAAPPGFQKRWSSAPLHVKGAPPPLHQIDVEISRVGQITIAGAPCSRARLYATMAAAVKAHEHRKGFTKHIALLADKAAAYDLVIKVLDAARQAGDNDVGFVTY